MEKKLTRAQKPAAQAFDEIKIICEPYFKQSGLSGDEWRTRYYTEFYRKGNLIHRNEGHTSLDSAVHLLSHTYLEAIDNGNGFFDGEGNYCDQEGCKEIAIIQLEQTKQGCDRCGEVSEPKFSRLYRTFCEKHSVRGDSRLDDMDINYIKLETKP